MREAQSSSICLFHIQSSSVAFEASDFLLQRLDVFGDHVASNGSGSNTKITYSRQNKTKGEDVHDFNNYVQDNVRDSTRKI
jgi:hypothetical protein